VVPILQPLGLSTSCNPYFVRSNKNPQATAPKITPAVLSASVRIVSRDKPAHLCAMVPTTNAVVIAVTNLGITSTTRFMCLDSRGTRQTQPVVTLILERAVRARRVLSFAPRRFLSRQHFPRLFVVSLRRHPARLGLSIFTRASFR
jgi:hypothetical protein